MVLLLSDTSKFHRVQFNNKHPVNKELRHQLDMQKVITDTLDKLLEDGYLSDNDYKFLKPCGSRPGVMYGLCEVAKGKIGNIPQFRPNISATGTGT